MRSQAYFDQKPEEHGFSIKKKGLISEMVSCGVWARAGPIWTLMGPYRPIWAHMGPYGPKRALYEPTICGPTM